MACSLENLCLSAVSKQLPRNCSPTDQISAVKQLPVPRTIQNVLEHRVKEMEKWIDKHLQLLDHDVLDTLVNCLVWEENSTINHLATARQIVQKKSLEPVDQFLISAVYCLGNACLESLEKLRDPNLVSEKGLDSLKFKAKTLQFPICSYWSRHERTFLPLLFACCAKDDFREAVRYIWLKEWMGGEDYRSVALARAFKEAALRGHFGVLQELWLLVTDADARKEMTKKVENAETFVSLLNNCYY